MSMSESLNKNPFPNDNIDPKLKLKDEFGKKVAKAIYTRGLWYDSVYSYRNKISERRKYARGQQDTNQYMPNVDPSLQAGFEVPGDSSYMNIDWSIQSPIPKYVNVIVGGLMNAEYKIQYNAIDPNSRVEKNNKRDEYFGKIMQKRSAEQISKMTGINISTNENIPEDHDEIDIWMDMEFKQPIEIAFEEIADWELYESNFNNIKKKVFHDLVEQNKAIVRTYWDENNNPRIRYVDPYYYISSFSNDENDESSEYQAEIVYLSLRELKKRANLPDDAWHDIAKRAAGKNGNPQWPYGGYYSPAANYRFDDYRIACLDFVYYSTDTAYYENKETRFGNNFYTERKFGFKPPKESKYKRELVVKNKECKYTGLWVIGTKHLLNYGKAKNITRKKDSPKVLRDFIVIEPNKREGSSVSLVDKMMPMADNIQILILKKRHFIASAIPAGARINVNAINEVMLGTNKIEAKDVLSLYRTKGIMLHAGWDDINGVPNNTNPVEELRNGIGGLVEFDNAILFEMQQIRDITGVNEARDASQPSNDALVGLQKLALLASNNATRELYEAYREGILEPIGKSLSRMVILKMLYGDGIDRYSPIIGKMGVQSLEFLNKQLIDIDLGIKIEALPDEEDIQLLMKMAQIELNAENIGTEDIFEIRNINVKKAQRYLIFKKKKRQQRELEIMAQKEQITSQREKEASLTAAQAEVMKQKAIAEKEIMVINAQKEADSELQSQKTKDTKEIENVKGAWKIEQIRQASFVDMNKTDLSEEQPQPKVFSSPAKNAKEVK